MLAQSSQLAQLRPSDTLVNEVYVADVETEITLIVVCNTQNSPANFSIYHDDDGASFVDATSLYCEKIIGANDTFRIELQHAGGGISVAPGGRIAVQASGADTLTFSMYGTTTRITG